MRIDEINCRNLLVIDFFPFRHGRKLETENFALFALSISQYILFIFLPYFNLLTLRRVTKWTLIVQHL